jgi:hypothetical protein
VALLVLLLSVDLAQKKHLSDLSKDINKESTTLQNKPQISRILTVQNQLESLTTLHNGKPAASRLFDTYLNEVTPATVSISTFHIDFAGQTATITGNANALSTINQYVDTLKFTTYTSDTVKQPTSAFSNVVLGSFGLTTGAKDANQAANYSITLAYDKNIFDLTQKVALSVPHLVTTRSELDQPGDLFKAAPATPAATTNGGGQ